MLDPRRHTMVTGSVVGAAIGICPYTSRQKLWKQLTGREDKPDLSDNPAVQWGIENEANGVHAYEVLTGELLWHNSADKFIVLNDRLGATPDAWNEDTAVQVKCPQHMYDAPPPSYVCQVALEAMCLELPRMALAIWTPDQARVWLSTDVLTVWEWMRPRLEGFIECLDTDTQPKRFSKNNPKPELPEINWKEI